MSPSLGPSALSATNHVKVLPTFQLPGHTNIFAVGDIIEWQEQRQAAKVAGHTGVVVPNVLDVLAGREPAKTYKGQWEIAVVSLGRVSRFLRFMNGEVLIWDGASIDQGCRLLRATVGYHCGRLVLCVHQVKGPHDWNHEEELWVLIGASLYPWLSHSSCADPVTTDTPLLSRIPQLHLIPPIFNEHFENDCLLMC